MNKKTRDALQSGIDSRLGLCTMHANTPHYDSTACRNWKPIRTHLPDEPMSLSPRSRIAEPPIPIQHRGLRSCGDSKFRKHCPLCSDGVLTVVRDASTFELRREDRCLNCGQEFIYTDKHIHGSPLPLLRRRGV